jgi:hypothetical protein
MLKNGLANPRVDILPHLNDETVAAYAGRKGLPQYQGC